MRFPGWVWGEAAAQAIKYNWKCARVLQIGTCVIALGRNTSNAIPPGGSRGFAIRVRVMLEMCGTRGVESRWRLERRVLAPGEVEPDRCSRPQETTRKNRAAEEACRNRAGNF
jgi:hypothetical protein